MKVVLEKKKQGWKATVSHKGTIIAESLTPYNTPYKAFMFAKRRLDEFTDDIAEIERIINEVVK